MIDQTYDLLTDNTTVRYNTVSKQFELLKPNGLSVYKKLNFRSFTGEVKQKLKKDVPSLKVNIYPICTNDFANIQINFKSDYYRF